MADVQVASFALPPQPAAETVHTDAVPPTPAQDDSQQQSAAIPSISSPISLVVVDEQNAVVASGSQVTEDASIAVERAEVASASPPTQDDAETGEQSVGGTSEVGSVESAQEAPAVDEAAGEASAAPAPGAAAAAEGGDRAADHIEPVVEALDEASRPANDEAMTAVNEVADDVLEALPFGDEEDIEHPNYESNWTPEPEAEKFPFIELEDSEMRDVVNGNFTCFYQQRCGQEFYRNYVRGNTVRKLRTDKTAIKCAPGALARFFQLPVEIIYDVLEMAHPMDLLHLSRSTKALRAILLNKNAEHVWKQAYENYRYDLPYVPEQISAPKWTAMMYDDSRCDFCGQLGALLDFAFEEHYCEDCQRKYLVEQNDLHYLMSQYPRVSDVIYQLLIPTYRQSGGKYLTYYESSNNARYRRKDVDAMIEALQEWYMTIDEDCIPDVQQKFEEWQQPLIDKANAVSDYAQSFNNWASSLYYTLCTELSSKQRSIAEQCMKRFVKAGYDVRDTDAACSDVYYYFRGVAEIWRMSPRVWEEHKAEMIRKIESHKGERLRRERREFVNNFYKEYKKTLKAEKWEHMPPSDILAYEDVFSDYINQSYPSDSALEELKTDEASKRIPEIIENWKFNRKKELYEYLPGASAEIQPYPISQGDDDCGREEYAIRVEEWRAEQERILREAMEQRMTRATTVFTCISCKNGRHAGKAVIGWEAACTHMCGSFGHFFHSNWEFCSVGYAAAAAMVRLVGMDSDTATIEDMDKRDARFFCGNCPAKTHNKVQGRKAYNWRECVAHAVEKEEDHTHAIPQWLLLSEDAFTFVKNHELPYPSPRKANWACNHCPEHIDVPVELKAAKAHLKEAHSIENPVIDKDVVYLKGRYERGHSGRRRPVFHYGIDPTCNLKCNLCRTGRVQKLWTIQALVPHLFHKHHISMPQSGRDYSKIEVLSTA